MADDLVSKAKGIRQLFIVLATLLVVFMVVALVVDQLIIAANQTGTTAGLVSKAQTTVENNFGILGTLLSFVMVLVLAIIAIRYLNIGEE